jgi:hypothetical protein
MKPKVLKIIEQLYIVHELIRAPDPFTPYDRVCILRITEVSDFGNIFPVQIFSGWVRLDLTPLRVSN